MQLRPRKTASKYAGSGWFWLDLVTSFPYDWVAAALISDEDEFGGSDKIQILKGACAGKGTPPPTSPYPLPPTPRPGCADCRRRDQHPDISTSTFVLFVTSVLRCLSCALGAQCSAA